MKDNCRKKDISNSDKDLEIHELKIELQSLLKNQSEPIMQTVIPDDYETLKKQVEALKESARKARNEASEAMNEAKAYKHSLETWKAGEEALSR